MKLLISPLITDEVADKYKYAIRCARTLNDICETMLIHITEIYLYPFLIMGNTAWSKDINCGSRALYHIHNGMSVEQKHSVPIHIIMDGDHHAEPFESIKHFVHYPNCYELPYCVEHTAETIEQFVVSIINNDIMHGLNDMIKEDSCFKLDSPFWLKRIQEIKQSTNLYK